MALPSCMFKLHMRGKRYFITSKILDFLLLQSLYVLLFKNHSLFLLAAADSALLKINQQIFADANLPLIFC